MHRIKFKILNLILSQEIKGGKNKWQIQEH